MNPPSFKYLRPLVSQLLVDSQTPIADRAVNIRLRRRKPSEAVEQYRTRKNDPELQEVQACLVDAINGVFDDLTAADPETPLEDRAADLWEPLLAVADAAGGSWPEQAREAAVYLTRQALEEDHQQSDGIDLLNDARNVLNFVRGDFIPTGDLIQRLKALEESPWRDTGQSPAETSGTTQTVFDFHDQEKQTHGYRRASFSGRVRTIFGDGGGLRCCCVAGYCCQSVISVSLRCYSADLSLDGNYDA